MDQRRINHGSTWINVDQASSAFSLQPSAFSLQHAAAVLTRGSCVMAHASCVMAHASCVMRPASDSWLMRPASGVRRHASCVEPVRRHASGVMRPGLMAHASGVRLTAHASCVMRHASGVRLTAHASDSTSLIQHIQPPPVVGHDDNRAAAFPHATPFRFAPIELYGMG